MEEIHLPSDAIGFMMQWETRADPFYHSEQKTVAGITQMCCLQINVPSFESIESQWQQISGEEADCGKSVFVTIWTCNCEFVTVISITLVLLVSIKDWILRMLYINFPWKG